MTELGRIKLMHYLFGEDAEHQCKTCDHILTVTKNRRWNKCKAYGISSSSSTDWRLKWTACGLYNKPYAGDVPIVELKKHMPKPIIETQCEGQMTIEDICPMEFKMGEPDESISCL